MNKSSAIALETFLGVAVRYNPNSLQERRMADARTMRECAAIIAAADESDIADALDGLKDFALRTKASC